MVHKLYEDGAENNVGIILKNLPSLEPKVPVPNPSTTYTVPVVDNDDFLYSKKKVLESA